MVTLVELDTPDRGCAIFRGGDCRAGALSGCLLPPSRRDQSRYPGVGSDCLGAEPEGGGLAAYIGNGTDLAVGYGFRRHRVSVTGALCAGANRR